MNMEDNFKNRVLKFVAGVPKGRVVSYGQVAAFCGSPRASRQVGGILGALGLDTKIPWWRVVNRDGIITIKNHEVSKELQKFLLEKDGVEVDDQNTVEINKYRYK